MKPTEEQTAILLDESRVIRINARAGTGKTTTLRMLSERHAGKRILYLVFNRKAREEARAKFPKSVEVHTVHSLAYRHEGRKWREVGDFGPIDFLDQFRSYGDRQHLAKLTHDFLVFFMNSPLGRLEDGTDEFKCILPEEVQGLFSRNSRSIVDVARAIAIKWNRSERPCPHDFYLKRFHQSGAFDEVLNRYDMILVDEAQDLSPIMVDALKRCKRRLVIVGDSHQQIYSFRYAVDAMRKIPSDKEHHLTISFRFGRSIAELTTLFIREAKQEQSFRISGNPGIRSAIRSTDICPMRRCAILSRTNLSLFSRAMELRAKRASFRFERDIDKVLYQVLDVFYLVKNEKSKIRNEWIQSFENFNELERYADKCEDFNLLGISQLVRKYSKDFPHSIFEMLNINRGERNGKTDDALILSTIHGSKGQEYERVYIDSDVHGMLSLLSDNGGEKYNEEVNVAYVGFTRSVRELMIPRCFEDLLSSKWRSHLEQTRRPEPTQRGQSKSVQSQATSNTGKRTWQGKRPSYNFTSAGNSSINFKTAHQKSSSVTLRLPRVGDKVETSNGAGRIIEISGDSCLIDLEGQPARLHEKLSHVKMYK